VRRVPWTFLTRQQTYVGVCSAIQGEGLRSTAAHMMNSNSSRSHCVFTLHLEIRAGADEKVSCCKVNFVDLAGSERTKKTNATGQMMKEAMYINRCGPHIGAATRVVLACNG